MSVAFTVSAVFVCVCWCMFGCISVHCFVAVEVFVVGVVIVFVVFAVCVVFVAFVACCGCVRCLLVVACCLLFVGR